MNNAKYTQEKTQKNRSLSKIGLYNQKVEDFLQGKTLTPLEQMAIKLFQDNAQRNRLSEQIYNKKVEEFNATHGFLLYKKGKTYEKALNTAYYSYINYPYIDTQAFRETMEKYRQYVHNYNERVAEENRDIEDYNATVELHYSLSDTDKLLKKEFQKKNSGKYTRDYNKLVEEKNKNLGIDIIPKKKIQTIKYTTEQIFDKLLGFYVNSLKKRNAYYLEMNKPTSCSKTAMPKLKVNQYFLANHKLKDVQRFDISKRTVQNHIKRLLEAGVLTDYTFHGQALPISVRFNTKILTVFDGNPPKSLKSENELFNDLIMQTLPNNRNTTGTFLKEKEIKGFASKTKCGTTSSASLCSSNESGTTSSAIQCPADGFYKNTTGASNEISKGGGQKISPKFPKTTNKIELLTDNFLIKHQDEQLLAELLASNYYEKYKGLRYDYLKNVAMYGLLSSEEFKAVLIQDFIKSSAKIWKNHSVYVGEWKKTINYLKDEIFKGITQKETMIKKLKEYRWKLEFARKWFAKHKEITALYPSLYFDRTREKSFEIGFFGLHKIWRKHLEIKKSQENNKKEAIYNGNRRKHRLSAQKKYGNAILKFHLGKMSTQKLFDYVQNNLPPEYLDLLAKSINNNLG